MAYERKLRSIGGSDVGTVLGLSEYRTPAQAWDRIMGYHVEATEDERFWQIRGKYLEPHIIRLYCHITGRTTYGYQERIVHPQHPFLHYTADSLIHPTVTTPVDGPGILEVKSLGPWTFRPIVDQGIAKDYLAQFYHGCFCTGYKWGSFAIMHADYAWLLFLPEEEWDKPIIRDEINKAFLWVDLEPDEEWLAYAVPKLLQWYEDYVETNTRPPMVQVDTNRIAPIARVGAESEDWSDNPVWNNAVLNLKATKVEAELANHALKLAENRVKDLMGDTQVALSVHGRISYKEGTRKNFNHKRLLEDHPEYASYYELAHTRTFRPTWNE